jgi:hypothetical protein
MAERGPREVLRRHGLRQQKALHQIKTYFTHAEKVGSGLDAYGCSASAKAIGKIEDLAAHRLFQAVVSAASDEVSADLDFDEGKVVQPNQRRPIRDRQSKWRCC